MVWEPLWWQRSLVLGNPSPWPQATHHTLTCSPFCQPRSPALASAMPPAVLVPTCQLSQIRHGPTGTGSASRLLSLPLKDFGVCLPLFCRPPFSSHLAFSPSGH